MKPLAIAVWGLPIWGVLQLGRGDSPGESSICGPWGCGPANQVLFALHSAWLLALLPLLIVIPRKLSRRWVAVSGWLLVLIGLGAVLGVGLFQAGYWLPQVTEEMSRYFFQRWAFAVVTSTDLPALQLGAIGRILLAGFLVKNQRTAGS